MCGKGCEVEETEKPVQDEGNCGTDSECPIIELDEEPKVVPCCCGVPMERVK